MVLLVRMASASNLAWPVHLVWALCPVPEVDRSLQELGRIESLSRFEQAQATVNHGRLTS